MNNSVSIKFGVIASFTHLIGGIEIFGSKGDFGDWKWGKNVKKSLDKENTSALTADGTVKMNDEIKPKKLKFYEEARIFFMAPIVKYFYYLGSYLIFLVLLSLMALFGLTVLIVEPLEIIVSIWVLGQLVDEIFEVLPFGLFTYIQL